jgi:hypothetical protein
MNFSGNDAPQKKAQLTAGPDFALTMPIPWNQWPKNNHSRMITGIGTPSSQSKMPRPIISYINSLMDSTTRSGARGSGEAER